MDCYFPAKIFACNNIVAYTVGILMIVGLNVTIVLQHQKEALLLKLPIHETESKMKDLVSPFFQCVMFACCLQIAVYCLMIMGKTQIMRTVIFIAFVNIVLIDDFGYTAGSTMILSIHDFQKSQRYVRRQHLAIEKLVKYKSVDEKIILCPLLFNNSVTDAYPFARYIGYENDTFGHDAHECESAVYSFFFECGINAFKYMFLITILQVIAFFLDVKMVKDAKKIYRNMRLLI